MQEALQEIFRHYRGESDLTAPLVDRFRGVWNLNDPRLPLLRAILEDHGWQNGQFRDRIADPSRLASGILDLLCTQGRTPERHERVISSSSGLHVSGASVQAPPLLHRPLIDVSALPNDRASLLYELQAVAYRLASLSPVAPVPAHELLLNISALPSDPALLFHRLQEIVNLLAALGPVTPAAVPLPYQPSVSIESDESMDPFMPEPVPPGVPPQLPSFPLQDNLQWNLRFVHGNSYCDQEEGKEDYLRIVRRKSYRIVLYCGLMEGRITAYGFNRVNGFFVHLSGRPQPYEFRLEAFLPNGYSPGTCPHRNENKKCPSLFHVLNLQHQICPPEAPGTNIVVIDLMFICHLHWNGGNKRPYYRLHEVTTNIPLLWLEILREVPKQRS
jgi:hypothetical protein